MVRSRTDLFKAESVKVQEIFPFPAENKAKIVRAERVFQTARNFRELILRSGPSDRTASQNMPERTVLTDLDDAGTSGRVDHVQPDPGILHIPLTFG